MRERMPLSQGRRFIWSFRHIIRSALTQQDTFTSRLSTSFIMGMCHQKVSGQTVKITLWKLHTPATSRST